MQGLYQPLIAFPAMKKLRENLKTPGVTLVHGLSDVAQTYWGAAMAALCGRPLVIVTANELRAKAVTEDLRFLLKGVTENPPLFFPAKDPLFYQADVRGLAMTESRAKVFRALKEGKVSVLVMSVEAFYDRLIPKKDWESFLYTKRIGEAMPIKEAAERLVRMGYERVDMVESPGQFSVRGGILDVFSLTEETAWRIELWDDEIDSIRVIDTETQRSVNRLERFFVYPAAEIMVDEKRTAAGIEKLKKNLKESLESLESADDAADKDSLAEAKERLTQLTERTVKHLESGNFRGLESYASLFYDDTVSIADYLPADTLLCYQDPVRIRERASILEDELGSSIVNRLRKGYLLRSQIGLYPDWAEIVSALNRFPAAALATLLASNQDVFKLKDIISVKSRSITGLQSNENQMLEELSSDCMLGYRTVLISESTLMIPRLVSRLNEQNITAYAYEHTDDMPHAGSIAVLHGRLSQGFSLPDVKLSFIPLREGSAGKKKSARRKRYSGTAISGFADLKVGDYVVHENHGVGIYQGIVQMDDRRQDYSAEYGSGTVSGRKDYFKIAYKDSGVLYVPTTSLDLLQKYAGGENQEPKLNRLGGTEWARTKNKVKESIAKLAVDLVKLYAARRARKGFAFSEDNVWQTEFEEMFPFEETDDQLRAIEDTKRDMENPGIMDRLICGDVGFGKTEVAIRAAFKAVQDGKQVAMLAPTTILAQQHYNTFVSRMREYPIRVDLLSRFCTQKQIAQTVSDLRRGAVDIVIGTHRLLSDDVQFKDLGLLIVDEEQRFGVGHKEKMKAMKETVDVLTLSATPIPRTLHMSLNGIRDMSLLEEAPQDRQPIQTYVMEDDEQVIREAIYRELARGGQVFYLHNRVHNIEDTALRVQAMVPEARVAFAHGQMSERELEKIMLQFVQGEIDVLVCTTIIETGLDIANANTIIIEDADRMGLAQLYQLRGRVGRSAKMAYAYLLYRRGKVLDEVAEKRLQAIGEFTELGSGFKIAMRDLEIRGAGNILGAEQHGHMGTVGYDLYCKLLEEAMSRLQHREVHEDFETTVLIHVNAFIPPEYIPNEAQKLQIYKKIAAIRNEDDFYDMRDEILDRYSDMPEPVENLVSIAYIKALGNRMGVETIEYNDELLTLTFRAGARIDADRIMNYVKENAGKTRLVSGKRTGLVLRIVRAQQGKKDLSDPAVLDLITEQMKKLMEQIGEEKPEEETASAEEAGEGLSETADGEES